MRVLTDVSDVLSVALIILIVAVLLVVVFLRRDLRKEVIARVWRKLRL